MPENAAKVIRLTELLSYEVTASGSSVELSAMGEEEAEVKLQLPYPMLGALLMTLPGAMQSAVRQASGDPRLRHAYHLGAWALERSAQDNMLLLSMATEDGFQVTFSLSQTDASTLADVISGSNTALDAVPSSRPH